MMGKPVRIVAWSLSLIALLLLSIWVFRLSLISWGVDLVAKGYGISNLEFQLDAISPSNTRVSDLSFDIDAGGRLLRIRSNQVQLSYDPEKIAGGEIETLKVDQLVINSTATEQPVSVETDIGLMVKTAAVMMSQPIAAKDIRVEQLSVYMDSETPLPGLPIVLVYAAQDNVKTFYAGHNGNELVVSTDGNTATFSIRDQQAIEAMSGKFSIDSEKRPATSFSGELKLDIGAARKLFESVTLAPAINNLEGSTTLSLTANREEQIWQMHVDGNFPKVTSDRFSLNQVNLSLDLKIPNLPGSEPVTFDTGSIVSIDSIGSETLAIRNFEIRPVGKYRWQDTRFIGHPDHPLEVSMDSLTFEKLELSSVRANLFSSFMRIDQEFGVSFGIGTSIEMEMLDTGDIKLDVPRLEFGQAGELLLKESGAVELYAQKLLAPRLRLQTGEIEIHSGPLEAEVRYNPDIGIFLGFSMDTPEIQLSDANLYLDAISGNLELNQQQWVLGGTFEPRGLPVQFAYHAAQQPDGGLDYSIVQQHPLDIENHADALNGLVSNWIPEITFESGEMLLQVSGQRRADGTLSNRIVTNLDNTTGKY
jgi:hypothetical protein